MLLHSNTSPCSVAASAIVVSYNSERFIRQCLDAVLASDYPVSEVVVVDNASQDETCSVVESICDARLIRNAENLGFAGGCNVGLSHVTGQVVAFVNPDVIVQPSWIGQMAKVMAEEPSVAIAGGKLLYPDQRTIQHAGGFLHYPLALADHYGYGQPDDGKWDQQRDVEYVTGAAVAARREALEDLGGFDEEFFPAYFEETDLCWRARQAGQRVVYVPSAVGIHYESTTTGKDSYIYYYYYHLNRLRFVLKNYELDQALHDFFPAEIERLEIISPEEEKRALDEAYRDILNCTYAQRSQDILKAMEQLSKRASKILRAKCETSGQNTVSGANVIHRIWHYVLRTRFKTL